MASSAGIVTEFRRWLDRTYDPASTVRTWWRALADDGWAFPAWPEGLGGRGLDRAVAKDLLGVTAASGTLGPPSGYAVTMTAPTLLRHGTARQQSAYVPRIARGELCGCQLFSEPEAGSDLASLRTRAVEQAGVWRVSGQKVWSSGAMEADLGMLLARTDAADQRHGGISYFLIDMHQAGVEVRPLRQMNGQAEFNEVFLDRAVVEPGDRIGDLNGGWAVAQTTLAAERSAVPPRYRVVPAGASGGWLDRTVNEALSARPETPEVAMFSRSGRASAKLLEKWHPPATPVLRDAVVQNHILSEISRWTVRRLGAIPGGPQIAKLQAAELARRARDVDLAIVGPAGMLIGPEAAEQGALAMMALSAHRVSIGGGTDQIQKNILAEKALGLPRT